MSKRNTGGKPPKEHQFKKGQSGNPNGRPLKKKAAMYPQSPLSLLAATKHKTLRNGVERDLTTQEVNQIGIYNLAMKGDIKAIRQVFKWIEKRENHLLRKQDLIKNAPVKLELESTNPRNVDQALQILGLVVSGRRFCKVNGSDPNAAQTIDNQETDLSSLGCKPPWEDLHDSESADDSKASLTAIREKDESGTKFQSSLVDDDSYQPQFIQKWFVEQALRRRRGKRRIPQERLDWILAYTIDAHTLNLPRGYQNDRR